MDSLLQIAGHGRAALPLDVLAALTLLSVAPFVVVVRRKICWLGLLYVTGEAWLEQVY
jgi:hypothetical protein